MSEHRTLDRLLLPRARAEPPGAHLVVPETHQPLPRWQTLPLDAKFPVTPAAKGQVTFVTTKICQPAYVSNQKTDFDLSDPYNRVVQSEYQPLSDPHLKKWLTKPYVRKQLAKQNLVTSSGNIPCTVRDFNHYRNYLRRQALMMNRIAETANQGAMGQAAEKRRHVLEEIKMKAELGGAEMKCRGLKAQQMQKEAEEERLRQFLKKQVAEEERKQRRMEEEAKLRAERVTQKRVKWLEKQSSIKARQEEERKQWQKKSKANELETLHKFNVLDNLRSRREWLQERRRKQQWEMKRQLQLQSLEETKELQKRVELDKEAGRLQYQVRMKSPGLRYNETHPASHTTATTVAADPKDTSPQFKEGSSCVTSTLSIQKIEHLATPGRKEREIHISRKTSMWIIEEALYSSGLDLRANSLFSSRSPQVYSRTLDHLIGSELDRNMRASVFGELQDSLCQVIHDIVKQVLAAHQDRHQSGPETDMDNGQTSDSLRFHQIVGTSLELAGPVRVCMCAAVSTDRNNVVERSHLQPEHHRTNQSDNHMASQPDNHHLPLDHRATLLDNHIRRSESDVFAMDAELTDFMTLLQESVRDTEKDRKIVELFLRLICHETLTVPSGNLLKEPRQAKEATNVKEDHLLTPFSSELCNFGNVADQIDVSAASCCHDNCNQGTVEVTQTQEEAASSFEIIQNLQTCRGNSDASNDCPEVAIPKLDEELSSLATNEQSCLGETFALCGDEIGSESQTNIHEIFSQTKTSPVTRQISPNEHQLNVNLDHDNELRTDRKPSEDLHSQMVSACQSSVDTNRNRLGDPDKPQNSYVEISDCESLAAIITVASLNKLTDVEGRVRESSSEVASLEKLTDMEGRVRESSSGVASLNKLTDVEGRVKESSSEVASLNKLTDVEGRVRESSSGVASLKNLIDVEGRVRESSSEVASLNKLTDAEGRVREFSSEVSSLPSRFIRQTDSCDTNPTVSNMEGNDSETPESCPLKPTVLDLEMNFSETFESRHQKPKFSDGDGKECEIPASCQLTPTISNVERNESEKTESCQQKTKILDVDGKNCETSESSHLYSSNSDVERDHSETPESCHPEPTISDVEKDHSKTPESCHPKPTISEVERDHSKTPESCHPEPTIKDREGNGSEKSECFHLKPMIPDLDGAESEPAMNVNSTETSTRNISFNNSQHPPSPEEGFVPCQVTDDQSCETGADQMTSPLCDEVMGMRPAESDVVQITARFLKSLQQSETLQGVGFPPSKICHMMTGCLSRLWHTNSNIDYVTTEWWNNSRLLNALQSLLNNVKMVKFPPELVHLLHRVIANTLLQQCSGSQAKTRTLPEYLTSVIYHGFSQDLAKKQINGQLLEILLLNLCEEYATFIESNNAFKFKLFLCKTFAQVQTFLDQGDVSGMDLTRNILNFGELAKDQQHLVLFSLWRDLLLQTRAKVQLSSLTPGQMKRLGDTLGACCKKLNLDTQDDLRSFVQKMEEVQTLDADLKLKISLLLSANVVVTLLPDLQCRESMSTSLLSVTLTSPSVFSPCILDGDTTGEAVVLLVLDSLAREIGEDTLDRRCIVGIVTSLAETLSRDYGYRKGDLTWEELTDGLNWMTSRFRIKSLEFQDSCKILSTILKPYLTFVLREDKDEMSEAEVAPLSMDEDLLSSLFGFLTEVYVTLVRGVIARVKEAGVKVECDDDSLVPSVWRIMACLAIEVRKLLSDQHHFPEEFTKRSKQAPKLDNLALEGLAESLGFQKLTTNPEAQGGSPLKPDSCSTIDQFVVSLTSRMSSPGYMPAPDLSMAHTARISASRDPTANGIDMALRKEVIMAAGQIYRRLLTDDAMKKIEVNVADMAIGTVVMLERFTGRVLETMMKLQRALTDGSLTPAEVAAFLQIQGINRWQGAAVSADMATNKVLELVLELKFLRKPLLAVLQVSENVASMCHGLDGPRGQNCLSNVRPYLLGSLTRGLMLFTLRALAWLLHCVYVDGSNVSFSKASFPKLNKPAIDAAFLFVKSNIDFIRNWPDKEKNSEGLWTPKTFSGNPKGSTLIMPYSVRKCVYLRLTKVIDSLGKEFYTTGTLADKTPHAADVATLILHEVLSTVSCQMEQEQILLVRLGDLFEPEKWKTTGAGGDKSSTFTRPPDSKQHPVAKLQQEESRVTLQYLVTHLTSLAHVLKQNIKAAVTGHETYDCLLQASAFIAARLDRVKQDLAKHIIVIAQPASRGNTRSGYPNARVTSKAIEGDEKDGGANLSKGGGTNLSEHRPADDKKLSVCQYAAKLFHYLTEVGSAIDPDCNIFGVIKELLKACYSVNVNMLSQKKRPDQDSGLDPMPVLLMEAIINELFNRLDHLVKARMKELDKVTTCPYLFSRIYTRPDPWGPYYSDVAIRARQLTDSFRAAGHSWSGKKELSVISNRDVSVAPEQAHGPEASNLKCEVETSSGEPHNQSKKQGEAKGRGRISSWRQRVKDTSTSHSADRTVTSWLSRGGRVTKHPRLSKIDSPIKKNTTGHPTLRQRSFDVSSKLQRTGTVPENRKAKRTDETGNNVGQVNQDDNTHFLPENRHKDGSIPAKDTGLEDNRLDSSCSEPKPPNKQPAVGNGGAGTTTNSSNKSGTLNVANARNQTKRREIVKTGAITKALVGGFSKETKKDENKSTARPALCTAKNKPIVQERINRDTSVGKISRDTSVGRINRNTSVARINRDTSVGRINRNTNVARSWPRVVHIIHHAYADQHNQEEKNLLANTEDVTEQKVSQNSLVTPQEQLEGKAASEGHSLEGAQEKSGHVNERLLVSMLKLEMPREMSAVEQMFGEDVVSSLSGEALVGVLSVCDTVMVLLSLGGRGEALSFLEGAGPHKKVSQRVAGAVNNILRSVMSGVVTDQQMLDLLAIPGEEGSHVNVTEVRGQLTARLSALVELVEDGCPVPGLCQSRGAEMVEVLTGLCQNSHFPRVSTPSPLQDSRERHDVTGSPSNTENSVSCGASSASSSSRDTDQSFIQSDNESNDDKCAMSSSWTMLSSCPSMSSSRSSNAVQGASCCSPSSKVLSQSQDNGRQPLISYTFDEVVSLDAEENAPRNLSRRCSETEKRASDGEPNMSKSSGSHYRSGKGASVKISDRSQSRSTGCIVDQSSKVDQLKQSSSAVSTKSAGCCMVTPVGPDSGQKRSYSPRPPASVSCSRTCSASSGHSRQGGSTGLHPTQRGSTGSHPTQQTSLPTFCPDMSESVGQCGSSRTWSVETSDKSRHSRHRKSRPAQVSNSPTSPASPDRDHQHPRGPHHPQNNTVDSPVGVDELSSDSNISTPQDGYQTGSSCASQDELEMSGSDRSDSVQGQTSPEQEECGIDVASVVSEEELKEK